MFLENILQTYLGNKLFRQRYMKQQTCKSFNAARGSIFNRLNKMDVCELNAEKVIIRIAFFEGETIY